MNEKERKAVSRELASMVVEMGNQTRVGEAIGFSQGAVSAAIQYEKVGQRLADAVCRYAGLTIEQLLQKHGLASGKVEIRPQYRFLPTWPEAATAAAEIGAVPDYAITAVGRWTIDLPVANPWPAGKPITAHDIITFAQLWMRYTPRHVIDACEREQHEREMRHASQPPAKPRSEPPLGDVRLQAQGKAPKKPDE